MSGPQIPFTQDNDLGGPAGEAALGKAEADKALADAAKAVKTAASAEAGLHRLASDSLPSSFLSMTDTKLQSTSAIELYRSHHIALTAARDDLAKFIKRCTKDPNRTQLPQAHRPAFTSAARFTPVAGEGNAAFYKVEIDALKKVENDASKAAFDLIVQGRKKFISHLESLVKTQSFITRAVTTHTEFVERVNRLHAERGSSTVVPLATAIAHFESKLRREMDAYDSEQIQAALDAAKIMKSAVDVENEAEKKVAEGADTGENIAQIAVKAVMPKQNQTEKLLNTALQRITQLERQLTSARAPAAAATSSSSSASRPATATSKGAKRKKMDRAPLVAAAAAAHQDHMDLSDAPVAHPAQQSNSRGGGRPHQSKKKKVKIAGKDAGKSSASNANQQQ
jgi:hypothetical protein